MISARHDRPSYRFFSRLNLAVVCGAALLAGALTVGESSPAGAGENYDYSRYDNYEGTRYHRRHDGYDSYKYEWNTTRWDSRYWNTDDCHPPRSTRGRHVGPVRFGNQWWF